MREHVAALARETMPHDADGVELKLNDVVTVLGRVTSLQAQEDYCNVTIQIIERPDNMKNSITLNTKSTRLKHRDERTA